MLRMCQLFLFIVDFFATLVFWVRFRYYRCGDLMICGRLILKRQEAGLSQAELARRIGVGRDSYNRYERAGAKPSLEVLARIATALNTSTDYLLGSTDDPTPPGKSAYSSARSAETPYELSVTRTGLESRVAESSPVTYNAESHRAVIQLDSVELSLITDFRDIDNESKNDLCRMAKILAENARLKRILKE